jgi:pilus assembly protein CpaB
MIAVALAVIAALLTSLYVSNYKRNVRNAESSVTVWVASKDIAPGVAGDDIVKRKLLTKQDVAKRNVVPGAISSTDQLDNQLVTQPIYAGEQVTARRFGSPSEVGVRSQLKGTVRALQIPGNNEQLLAGTLKDGDRVDVVADVPLDQNHHFARIELRNVLVLKAAEAPSTSTKISSASGGDASVTLAVRDDKQAQKLQWIIAEGRDVRWSLALRAPTKAADSPEDLETLDTMLKDGVSQAELNRAAGRSGQ